MAGGNLVNISEAFTVTKGGKFLDYWLYQYEAFWFFWGLIKEAECLRRFCYSFQGFEMCVLLVYAALMVVSYGCFRKPIGPILRIKRMGCHKTLVINYLSVLCNNPEEITFHLHHGGSLKTCIWSFLVTIMCCKCHSLRCCFLFCCPVLQNLCKCNFFLHIVFNCGLLAIGLCLLSRAQTYINTKK
jgi:hypothetical protein